MDRITKKQFLLTGYLEHLIKTVFEQKIKIITPQNVEERGSQLSLEFFCDLKEFHEKLEQQGVLVSIAISFFKMWITFQKENENSLLLL